MSTSMRAGTRHGLYQSCVRGDSVDVPSIEVARVNALAIAQRGETRRDAASGESREQTGMGGHALGGAALASRPGIVEVGAPEAWRQLGVTGKGIGVAILDSGIAPHPDLAGRIVAAVDFTGGGIGATLVAPADPGGHGTHVAGLVAGDGTASGGAYAGVAPGAA